VLTHLFDLRCTLTALEKVYNEVGYSLQHWTPFSKNMNLCSALQRAFFIDTVKKLTALWW